MPPTACKDSRIKELVDLELLDCRQAMRIALDRILEEQVGSCWSDAGRIRPPEWAACGEATYAGDTIVNCSYRLCMPQSPEAIWAHISGIGGDN